MHATDLLSGRNSFISVLALVLPLAACGGGGAIDESGLHLERIDAALDLNTPLFLTSPPGGMNCGRTVLVAIGAVIVTSL